MLARSLALALLVVPIFAGCITPEELDASTTPPAALGAIEVAEGATLVEETGRAILRWTDIALPFTSDIVIPEGTTLVRLIGVAGPGDVLAPAMKNTDTGRRRCNRDYVDAWNVEVVGETTCSGIARIDPPGAKWTVQLSGDVAKATRVDLVFETTPLDGLVSELDLSRLSMPDFEPAKTEYLKVASFDGTLLHVEVTRPEGEGPWPTIISSSPYNGNVGRFETPAQWAYFAHDWVKRGYAVVAADVRGFGLSGGCVEVWGPNEAQDQAFLVDWTAAQEWSDGNVGFYGQSYVATTPVEAAVRAPEALKAIVIVAPVMNTYFDWHYGGVPNSESTGSPRYYQTQTDAKPYMSTDPAELITGNTKGVCDPTLVQRANDPRAVYDSFYVERNFSALAKNVKAAVLYTQGFEDSNVKSAMIPWWFNDIESPKLGLFGHWVHQHPSRADQEILFLGWMDQYVKGRDLGFEKLPAAEIVLADSTQVRQASAWPPVAPDFKFLRADFAKGALTDAGAPASTDLVLALPVTPPVPVGAVQIVLEADVLDDFAFAGTGVLAVTGTLKNGGNAFFRANLYDVAADGTRALVTYGAFNLALRNGYDSYEPAGAGERVNFALPFLPTEHLVKAGHRLSLEVTAVPTFASNPYVSQPGVFTLEGGEGTELRLPLVDVSEYVPIPATATR